MKADTARLIVDELEEAFRNINVSFERGIRELLAMTQRDLTIWKNSGDRAKLEQALTQYLPEPSPPSLGARLAVIRHLPCLLRLVSEGSTPKVRGRRRELYLVDARVICKEINRLDLEGVSAKDAVLRMAQRYNVSRRTIQRVWSGRNKPGSPFYLNQPDVEGEGLHFKVKAMRPDPSIQLILKRQESQKKKKRK